MVPRFCCTLLLLQVGLRWTHGVPVTWEHSVSAVALADDDTTLTFYPFFIPASPEPPLPGRVHRGTLYESVANSMLKSVSLCSIFPPRCSESRCCQCCVALLSTRSSSLIVRGRTSGQNRAGKEAGISVIFGSSRPALGNRQRSCMFIKMNHFTNKTETSLRQ